MMSLLPCSALVQHRAFQSVGRVGRGGGLSHHQWGGMSVCGYLSHLSEPTSAFRMISKLGLVSLPWASMLYLDHNRSATAINPKYPQVMLSRVIFRKLTFHFLLGGKSYLLRHFAAWPHPCFYSASALVAVFIALTSSPKLLTSEHQKWGVRSGNETHLAWSLTLQGRILLKHFLILFWPMKIVEPFLGWLGLDEIVVPAVTSSYQCNLW